MFELLSLLVAVFLWGASIFFAVDVGREKNRMVQGVLLALLYGPFGLLCLCCLEKYVVNEAEKPSGVDVDLRYTSGIPNRKPF